MTSARRHVAVIGATTLLTTAAMLTTGTASAENGGGVTPKALCGDHLGQQDLDPTRNGSYARGETGMHTGPSYTCGRLRLVDTNDVLDYHCRTYRADSSGHEWTLARHTASPPDLPSSYGWIRNDKLSNGGSDESCLGSPF